MADLLFHYTTGHLAQEIAISGILKPGSGGKLYLTDDTYSRGVDATRRLAIPNKAVEITLVVERSRLDGLSEPRPVGPFRDETGAKLRPGGGTERWTTAEVELRQPVAWNLSVL